MNRPYFTATFWLDTTERAVKTLAQSLLGVIAAQNVNTSVGRVVDFEASAWIIGIAVLSSVLTSIISTTIGERGTASLLDPAPPDTLEVDRGQATIGGICFVIVVVLALLFVLTQLGWI